MPVTNVTIDAAFLAAAGNAPYVLKAYTHYTLAQDVDVASATFFGEPFRLLGPDTELILAGHKVTVNGKPVPQRRDTQMEGPTSQYAVRTNAAESLLTYGGEFWDARKPKLVVEPGSIGYPQHSTSHPY